MIKHEEVLLSKLQEIAARNKSGMGSGSEFDHIEADNALVEYLRGVGLYEAADLFLSIERWYV